MKKSIILAAAAGTAFADLERVLAEHKCNGCHKSFEVNSAALAQPFCLHCGSVDTSLVDTSTAGTAPAGVKMAVPEEAEVSAVVCANTDCGSLNVMDNDQLATLKSFNCVSCGSKLTVACDPAPVVVPGAPGPVAAAPSTDPTDPAVDGEGRPVAPKDGDAPINDTSPAVPADPDPAAGSPAPAAAPTPIGDPPGGESDVVEVDMCDMVDPAAASASIIQTAEAIWIRAGGQFVAELLKSEAGANADIFEDEALSNAIQAGLANKGLVETISDFGFKPFKVKLALSKHIAKAIEAGVVTAKAEVEAGNKGFAENFQQCLSISLLGHTTGFFRDVTDPLQAAMVTSLKDLNVRGAKGLVASVFASHGKEFAASVVAKAVALQSSTVEYRNDIAANLDKLDPGAGVTDEGKDPDSVDSDELESRLASTSRASILSSTRKGHQDAPQKQVAAILKSRTERSLSPYRVS